MSLLDDQLRVLQEEFADANIKQLPDGSHVVTVPGVDLPQGWLLSQTTVKFHLAPSYPHGRPDCFWAEPALRLKNGAQPQNTNIQAIPGTSEAWLWFSWHASHWNPNRDTLTTYMNIIRERLRRVQ
jgi:hypothetical protein